MDLLADLSPFLPSTHLFKPLSHSPNHLEALTLLSLLPDPLPAPQPSSAETKALISLATKTLASFMSPGGTAVVRSGGDGVCFCSSTGEGGEVGEVKWVEAVFGKDEQSRVIDVTGGGNGFLGGMGAGLLISGGDVYEGEWLLFVVRDASSSRPKLIVSSLSFFSQASSTARLQPLSLSNSRDCRRCAFESRTERKLGATFRRRGERGWRGSGRR